MLGIPMSKLPSLALADGAVISPMDDVKHVFLTIVNDRLVVKRRYGLMTSELMGCRSESLVGLQ